MLLSMRHSNHDPPSDFHTLSHGNLAVGAGGGPGQPAVDDSLSNYLSAIQGLNSASEVGKNVGKFLSKHQAGGSPLLLNLRPPTARAAVPIQLLVPEFQQLLSAVWTERQEAGMGGGEGTGRPEVSDWQFARDLCLAMSQAFENEDLRVKELKRLLTAYFDYGNRPLTSSRPFQEVGDLVLPWSALGGIALIVEIKNEAGISGDAGLQGQIYYAKSLLDEKHQHLLVTSHCPALLVEVVGPQLRISGLAFAGLHVVCEPLTPTLCLLDLYDRQPEQVRMFFFEC
jgi:hypothetical protein